VQYSFFALFSQYKKGTKKQMLKYTLPLYLVKAAPKMGAFTLLIIWPLYQGAVNKLYGIITTPLTQQTAEIYLYKQFFIL
jgi:hypothetical protein